MLRLAEGRLFMFLAIDRVSKFARVAFLDANTKLNGAAFLREVVAAFPYAIHKLRNVRNRTMPARTPRPWSVEGDGADDVGGDQELEPEQDGAEAPSGYGRLGLPRQRWRDSRAA